MRPRADHRKVEEGERMIPNGGVARLGWVACAVVAVACGASPGAAHDPAQTQTAATTATPDTPPASPATAQPPPSSPPPAIAPFTKGAWTFYDSAQGLSKDIADVSADEAGNVFVAGTDALYAKKRGDAQFLRFDATNAGLTKNCYPTVPESDPGFAAALDAQLHPTPPGAAQQCPVVSVAGASAGRAIVGFQGLGTDSDGDADWAMDSGGADVVTFDGTNLTRLRHVLVASPPHTICADNDFERHATSCDPNEFYWNTGRRKLRQVFRIAVNHRAGTAEYGDVWMGGTHATFAALLNDPASRGYPDRLAGQPARWDDAKDVWEHDHPAFYDPASNLFLTGYTYAVAIDPRNGIPWASNGFRTAYMAGYPDLSTDNWWLEPIDATHPFWIDVWPDGTSSPLGGAQDHIESLSFCDDGTLWMGSSTHGLAVRDPSGSISGVAMPDPATYGDNVYAVACDPSDHSVWIGLGWGGVMRYKDGQFSVLDVAGLPGFASQPVRSIQIDRWSNPRRVYFAFIPSKDASGTIVKPGGIAEYAGP
jgi:hypothetical protein